jgi:hypothetical protein
MPRAAQCIRAASAAVAAWVSFWARKLSPLVSGVILRFLTVTYEYYNYSMSEASSASCVLRAPYGKRTIIVRTWQNS